MHNSPHVPHKAVLSAWIESFRATWVDVCSHIFPLQAQPYGSRTDFTQPAHHSLHCHSAMALSPAQASSHRSHRCIMTPGDLLLLPTGAQLRPYMVESIIGTGYFDSVLVSPVALNQHRAAVYQAIVRLHRNGVICGRRLRWLYNSWFLNQFTLKVALWIRAEAKACFFLCVRGIRATNWSRDWTMMIFNT